MHCVKSGDKTRPRLLPTTAELLLNRITTRKQIKATTHVDSLGLGTKMRAIMLVLDEVPCVIRIMVMTSRRTSMIALILVPRPGLATRVVALICFLVALLSSRGPAIMGNRWSRVLPPNLTQGISGQALNFMNLRSVWQGLHQYSRLGQVDQRTVKSIVSCFVQVLLQVSRSMRSWSVLSSSSRVLSASGTTAVTSSSTFSVLLGFTLRSIN